MNPSDLRAGRIWPEGAVKVPEDVAVRMSAYRVREGDVVLGRRGELGRYGLVGADEEGYLCGTGSLLVRPNSELMGKFLGYYLETADARDWLGLQSVGSTMENLSEGILSRLPLPDLPFSRQQQVSYFLDEQTARIDALIAEKERLAVRVGELGTSRLAHEMSGGGNSNNPTHYEWYPKVPQGWRVLPFKHAVKFIEGPGILANDFRDEGIPLLRVSSVRGAEATLDGCNYLDPAKVAKTWKHFQVKRGDLLISASASMGTVSMVTEETEGAVPYTGIIILRAIDGMATRDFVRNFVVSDQFMRQIDVMKAGATIQHFGPTHLGQLVMAAPVSLAEQDEVAKRLDNWRGKQASMAVHVAEHIARLREYRSSLISAAVTGQVDIGTHESVAA